MNNLSTLIVLKRSSCLFRKYVKCSQSLRKRNDYCVDIIDIWYIKVNIIKNIYGERIQDHALGILALLWTLGWNYSEMLQWNLPSMMRTFSQEDRIHWFSLLKGLKQQLTSEVSLSNALTYLFLQRWQYFHRDLFWCLSRISKWIEKSIHEHLKVPFLLFLKAGTKLLGI